VARGPETGVPALIGLVTLYDPPRPDAKQLIAELHDLGVPVKMLTGDALAVASEIARGVGLSNIRPVADLKAAAPQVGNERWTCWREPTVSRRFFRGQICRGEHLQAAGHVAGMTGDGVNDAPALRQAEVGIAVSTATDVAKGAASVVLTEPGLTNIVALVEQGRTIYQRILTYIINKISRTILKTAFVAIAFMVTGKFVMSSFAMLLLVLSRTSQRYPWQPIAFDRQETGDVEYRAPDHRFRGAGRIDGRRGASRLVERLVTLRIGGQQQCPLYVLFPDPAVLCRVFHRIRTERRWFWRRCPAMLFWWLSWRKCSSAPS